MSNSVTIPPKLKPDDTIQVIAPSQSGAVISQATRAQALYVFQDLLKLKVTFGKHIEERDLLRTSSRKCRLADLHAAFADPDVKAIFTMIGGFSTNQLYDHIDYDLISQNPKILCGYSDITGLCLAIYKKCAMMTYVGPHFSSLGMRDGCEYTIEYLRKTLMEDKPVIVEPAKHFSSDEWYLPSVTRTFIPNDGPRVLYAGKAAGLAIGGNISLLRLIQGTTYFPRPSEPFILFLEDDDLVRSAFAQIFHQQLVALFQDDSFNSHVTAIVVGRCQPTSEMSIDLFRHIFDDVLTFTLMRRVPVVIDASFGHTTPIFTIPIGGNAKLDAELPHRCAIAFTDH